MKLLLLVFMSEIKIDLTLKIDFYFRSSIFMSGGATSETITLDVHE